MKIEPTKIFRLILYTSITIITISAFLLFTLNYLNDGELAPGSNISIVTMI